MEEQEAGILSGSFFRELTVVFLVFSLAAFAPFVGIVALVFLPFPIFYYYSKHNRAWGLALSGLSISIFCLILLIIDLRETAAVFVTLTFLGVMMAEVVKRNISIEKTVFYIVAATFVLGIVFVLYQSFQFWEAPWHMIGAYIEKKVHQSISLYEYMGISSEQINIVKENKAGIVAFITKIFPAICLVGMILTVWLNLLEGKIIFPKHGLPYPDFGNLNSWKAPEKMVWFLIAAGIILLLPEEKTKILGWNVLIVILFIYLLAGVAIVDFILKKIGIYKGIRYVILFLVFAQQFITLVVIAVGIFDLWVDFRKLNRPINGADAVK